MGRKKLSEEVIQQRLLEKQRIKDEKKKVKLEKNSKTKEQKKEEKELKKADEAFFDLVERARHKGALIGEPELISNL